MNRTWIAVITAAAAGLLAIGYASPVRAASNNETGLPEEADVCQLVSPAATTADAGDPVTVVGRILESDFASTGGPDPVPGLIAEAGIGPFGSDPRTDAGWSFASLAVSDASAPDGFDVYEGGIVAPMPVNNTQYALTVRYSLDLGFSHTYCDLDIAGSFPGFTFDPAQLGVVTVYGTGGLDNGSVTTTISPEEAPGPCILLDTTNIDYGVLAFSTSLTPRSAGGEVTVTNCNVEAEDILARGADATGPTATWVLETPPGPNDNMCDLGSGGVNEYGHAINQDGNPAIIDLTTTNQTYQGGLGAGGSVLTETTLSMPCSGSDGAGELMSTSITFTAVAISPGP